MLFASRKPRQCPECGASPVASILWGLPAMTAELEEKLAQGTVTPGGCCIEEPSPMWHCNVCNTDIYHERDRSELQTDA